MFTAASTTKKASKNYGDEIYKNLVRNFFEVANFYYATYDSFGGHVAVGRFGINVMKLTLKSSSFIPLRFKRVNKQ